LHIGLPIYRQQVAIREIERCGGIVGYDFETRIPEWIRDLFDEDEMVPLESLDRVVSVDLWMRATDAMVAYLEELVSLKEINLAESPVTDAGLAHLTKLTRLEELRLNGTEVTDAGVARLQTALPRLTIYR